MRLLLTLLLLLVVAFSGCLEDDEADETEDPTDEPMDEAPEEEPQVKDRGEYTRDLTTGQCDAKEYTDVGEAGLVYQSEIGGGTWAFAETNGIPGLQYENNHPLAGTGAGFDLPVDEECANGDQAVL